MSWEVLLSDHVGQSLPRSVDWVGPATVSHLAVEAGEQPRSCLRSQDRPRLHWASDTALASIPIRRGERLALVSNCCAGASDGSDSTAVAAVDSGRVCAFLEVRSGPDAGRSFSVPLGVSTIGRGRTAEFRLTDRSASRRAFLIEVQMNGRHPSLHIEALATAVQLDGAQLLGRSTLAHGSTIRLGATTLAVSVPPLLSPSSTSQADRRPTLGSDIGTAHIPIERSPVQALFDPPLEVSIDAFPAPSSKQAFPLLTVAIGVAMAVALLAITPAGPFAVLYLMGPLMLMGAWAEQRRSTRRSHASSVSNWRQHRDEVSNQLRAAASAEASALEFRFPTSDSWAQEIIGRGPRIWECLPGHGDPWALRLGNGACVARSHARFRQGVDGPQLGDEYQPLEDARCLSNAPVVIDLSVHRHLAVVGSDSLDVAARARAIVLQLAARVGPADAALASCFAAEELSEWSWLRWLPHTHSAESLLGEWPHARPSALDQWWSALDRWLRSGGDHGSSGASPRLIVIASELAQPSRSRLFDLLGADPADAGSGRPPVSLLWIGTDATRVPSFVDSIVRLGSGDEPDRVAGPSSVFALGAPSATQGFAEMSARSTSSTEADDPHVLVHDTSASRSRSVNADRCALAVAERAAIALAPAYDAEQPDRSTSMPRSIPIDSVQRRSWSSHEELSQAWRTSVHQGLAAPIGVDADRTVWIDLVADGPHALIAGTTGSGKSALLQTWCLSLALEYSPVGLNFLFVDYKGGAAFGALEQLPHCVGSITNLGPSEVVRTLDSLEAELTFRMRVLAAVGAADIESYSAMASNKRGLQDTDGLRDSLGFQGERGLQDERGLRGPTPMALARLVVVVDEFAALAHERPEFLHSLVDLAARGRSLGVHLILATQRPRGVVSDDIRANMALRISLRVTDTDESIDIVGDPSAASLDRSCPGRAILADRSGSSRRIQIAHCHTSGVARDQADVTVSPLRLWASPSQAVNDPRCGDTSPAGRRTLAEQIVERCVAAHRLDPFPLRTPCAPPLPTDLSLANLRADWVPTAAGLFDVPDQQLVEPFVWNPMRDSNAIIVGPARSGRSTALCALVTAVHFADGTDGAEAQTFWVIDPDGQLAPLATLPRTAAYATGSDPLAVLRILSQLEQRSDAPHHAEHHTLVVDNLPALGAALGRFAISALDQIERLSAAPRSANVSVLLAADRRNSVPSRVWAAAETRIQMASSNSDDLLAADVDARLATTLTEPGQATADGRHRLQFAHASGEQIRSSAACLKHVPSAARFEPPGPVTTAPTACLDWAFEVVSLRPAEPSFSAPVVVIFGPAGSGKSSALCREAERSAASGAAVLVWRRSMAGCLVDIVRHVERTAHRPLRVLVDDAHLLDESERREISAGIAATDPARVRWFISADSHRVHRFDESIRTWTRFRNGILLQPTLDRDGDLFDVVLPGSAPIEQTPGTGVLIVPNRPPTFVQVLLPISQPTEPHIDPGEETISDHRSAQSNTGDHSPARPLA